MKLLKLFFLTVLITSSSSVFAQTSADLKRKKEALQRDIALLQKGLNEAEKSKKTTITQVNAIKTQIRLRQSKIEIVNTQIKNLDAQINESTNKVRNLTGQLGDLKKEYASMIRFAQRNKNTYDKMMFIFAADNFNQAYKRIKYLQQFSQYRKKQAGYIEGKQKDLNKQIQVLDKDLKEKNLLLQDQEQERKKLLKNRDEQSVVLSKYTKQESQLKNDIQKRRNEQNNIDRALREILKKELDAMKKREEEEERLAIAKAKTENKPIPVAKAKTASTGLSLAPDVAKLSAAFESNKGNLPWPVDNKLVTESFGRHKFEAATTINDGVNIQTNENAAVKAVFSGTVKVSPYQGRFMVLINHGKYITVYANLESVTVNSGDKVTAKQKIGVAGDNGGVPEIKFQIHQLSAEKSTPLNPESWLAQ